MRAALIAEGPSDRGLTDVLARLCRRLGVAEVEVEWANELLQLSGSGNTVEAKISTLLRADPEFDLLFVHRDADKDGLDARREQIHAASVRAGEPWPLVSVVPVTEMEAWLVVDEQRVREVVGNPSGKTPIGLPKLARVEMCSDPKSLLRAALQAAGRRSRSGKRASMSSAEFGLYRARLLESLDIEGPVTELRAWQVLVAELRSALVEADLCRPEPPR